MPRIVAALKRKSGSLREPVYLGLHKSILLGRNVAAGIRINISPTVAPP